MMNIVWVVEDMEYIREEVEKVLNDNFIHTLVVTFGSGQEVIDFVGEKPDVIILDLGLPDMDGLQVLLTLRYRYQEAKILIYTIYEDSQHLFEALKFGANGYLLKGILHNRLVESILEIMNGGAPMSRSIAKKVFESFHRNESEITSLTNKEIIVLQLLSSGLLYKEIADKMSLSINTVKNHIKSIYGKLHVQNSREAILKFMHNNDK
ncbi:MAG: response regulator transcription factor [Saprospiraceae bacterium]|nr:response regulator transcription factor [Saprospiraceae bacterium]